MDPSQQKSHLSYRPCVILWIDSGSSDALNLAEYKRVKGVARRCDIPIREVHGDHLSNTDIAHIIATLEVFDSGAGLPILIVGGLYLEDQVSRCCLQALAHGYDTHLLCDAIFPLEKEMVQNHLSRLTQAGAVPSSLNQITSFLIADESDAQVVAELQLHIRIDK